MKKKGSYSSLKLFFKILVLMIILACVAPFFLKGPNDRPLLKPENLKLPEVKMPNVSDAKIPELKGSQQPEKIYKWKDRNGVWHFSDKQDPDVEAEVILVAPGRRQKQVPDNLKAEKTEKTSENDGVPRLSFPMTISPSDAKKLKQDAEKIKIDLEKRYKEMRDQLADR